VKLTLIGKGKDKRFQIALNQGRHIMSRDAVDLLIAATSNITAPTVSEGLKQALQNLKARPHCLQKVYDAHRLLSLLRDEDAVEMIDIDALRRSARSSAQETDAHGFT
jgi:hypothetical protein